MEIIVVVLLVACIGFAGAWGATCERTTADIKTDALRQINLYMRSVNRLYEGESSDYKLSADDCMKIEQLALLTSVREFAARLRSVSNNDEINAFLDVFDKLQKRIEGDYSDNFMDAA